MSANSFLCVCVCILAVSLSSTSSTLSCNGDTLGGTVSVVSRIQWFFSPDHSNPMLLDVDANPQLSTNGASLHLDLSNITGAYEGIYFCQVEYTDGQLSALVTVGCVFVAGKSRVNLVAWRFLGVGMWVGCWDVDRICDH